MYLKCFHNSQKNVKIIIITNQGKSNMPKQQVPTRQRETKKVQRRRRGEELNKAVYTAALEILEKDGYDAITFQAIAKKAKTSRSVLYRTWKTPFLLVYRAVLARLRDQGQEMPRLEQLMESFDGGSLRADLLHLTDSFIKRVHNFPRELYSTLMTEVSKGTAIFDFNIQSNLNIMKPILKRAKDRGEIQKGPNELECLLPFQILRYYIIFSPQSLNDHFIEQLVDDIFLPIYTKKEKLHK